MKNKLLIALLIVITTGMVAAHAQRTPEEMITLYFDAFKAGNYELMSANMHADELAKLQKELLPVVARGIDAAQSGATKDELAMKLFADSESYEVISKESPEAFFIRFMNWLNRMNPMMKNTLAGSSIATVGHVTEGDLAHVVYRVSVNIAGTRMTQLNVMSVKKDGEDWKLMMSGEIEGMGKLLQRDAPKF